MNKEFKEVITEGLAELKAQPLSDKDILRLTDNKTKVIMYPELAQYETLDDVFGDHDSITLLYLQKENLGHWCCVNFINDSTIEFFDPYGIFIDDELEFTSPKMQQRLNQRLPVLSKLFKESPYKLTYNEHQFQELGSNIATCGRHCVVRIVNREKPLKIYKNMIKSLERKTSLDADDIVSILTR